MSLRLLVLRHGPTDWNAQGLIQGRTDRPLGAAGRAALERLALPADCRHMRCVSSPLARCVETARALGFEPEIEDALIEMDWGACEGRRLSELRADADFVRAEARGLDFRPQGGESPRQVQARLSPWLAKLAAPTLAVTHKGTIRALLALATDWPMLGKPPVKFDWRCLQEFAVEDGRPRLARANLAFEARA